MFCGVCEKSFDDLTSALLSFCLLLMPFFIFIFVALDALANDLISMSVWVGSDRGMRRGTSIRSGISSDIRGGSTGEKTEVMRL